MTSWCAQFEYAGTTPLPLRHCSAAPKLIPQGRLLLSSVVGAASREEAHAKLQTEVRWCLLYSHIRRPDGQIFVQLPFSNSNLLMPEEFPLLLAFYHLGNVVRYDPERLQKLFDSEAIAVLETLRRHGMFQYMKAIWCYVNQTQTLIIRQ